MSYTAAESQCKSDGALLAVPRFESENNFIADLITTEFWIGVNDIKEEGKFVTVEGNLSYTNWGDDQPTPNGNDEDGVELNHGYWNDARIDELNPFICLYRTIESGKNRKNHVAKTIQKKHLGGDVLQNSRVKLGLVRK